MHNHFEWGKPSRYLLRPRKNRWTSCLHFDLDHHFPSLFYWPKQVKQWKPLTFSLHFLFHCLSQAVQLRVNKHRKPGDGPNTGLWGPSSTLSVSQPEGTYSAPYKQVWAHWKLKHMEVKKHVHRKVLHNYKVSTNRTLLRVYFQRCVAAT